MSKFRTAADLTYYTQQAMRHAIMLEMYHSHGLDAAPALYLVVQDLEQCALAVNAWRMDLVAKEMENQHDSQ